MVRSSINELSKRDMLILGAIVGDYIKSPEPVGSKTISRKYGLNLSPATIRHIASELEEKGYLEQPHTSSGRVPTDKGFRLYVDRVVTPKQLTSSQKSSIESRYDLTKLSFNELLSETSRMLSKISHNAGLVLSPRLSTSIFRRVDFVKLSKSRILVIFVTDSGALFESQVRVSENFSESDLYRASNYLNDIMHGLNLIEVRKKISDEMKDVKVNCDRILARALKLVKIVTEDEAKESGILINGATNIINDPVFKDITEIKSILGAFEDKKLLMKILDKCIHAEGTATFIGVKDLSKELSNVSIVSANYLRNNDVLGTVGVIGPRRMDYARVIPLVDYMSKLLSRFIEVIN